MDSKNPGRNIKLPTKKGYLISVKKTFEAQKIEETAQ